LLVWNKKTVAVAAADSVDPQRWLAEFETAFGQVAGRFARRDVAAGARDLLAGLVAPLERKNCWTIAEHVGHDSPHRLQHLLGVPGVAARFFWPRAVRRSAIPPPSGMFPTFFTSTWMSDPGSGCS
jgi:hypothetical protein